MNTFLTVLCLALVASASANPAYNYQQPPKVQLSGGFKPQVFRPSQPASSSGIYSAVQAAPLTSFTVPSQQQVKQNFASQPVEIPAPSQFAQQFVAPAPQHVAPVQQKFVAPAQQQFVAPAQQQFVAPAQQQFVAPAQQQQQFAAPVHQQQQFAAPVQQQQQFTAPVQQQQFAGPVVQQQQFVAPIPQKQYVAGATVAQPQYQPQQQTIISKDIFIHSAPEEVEEIGNDIANQPTGPIRKNYRIVFIKAPNQNVKLNLDALKRAQSSNEEKTVIYVLSKKPDLSEIQNQLAVVQNDQKSHKPEVYFIKYKTQEEANRAQQEIQAQYDSLGGSTHISDEGIAPVTSVIGGGPVHVASLGGNVGSFGGSLGGNVSFGNNNGQQQFVQQSYQTSQSTVGASSSTVSFGDASSQKYLPAKKK